MSARAGPREALVPLSEEDEARADFYALLARLFGAPPDAALLAALAQAGALHTEGTRDMLAAAWKSLVDAAANTDADREREAYDRLFIGVGRPEVMLYGSWYQAGFMMERPLALLREDLAALELSRVTGVCEPEDHFSALAEVMRHLVLECAPDSARRQQRFFTRHIGPWYEKLADALDRAPEAGLYEAAGRFARAFLDIETASFRVET